MQRLAIVWLAAALASSAALAPAAASAAESSAAREQERSARKKPRAPVERPYGKEGDPRKVRRVITIDMSDTMRFFPEQVRVKRGDTVRFELRNRGELRHSMIIGTMEELKKQAASVKKNLASDETEGPGTQVAPGGTGRLVWQFTRAGEYHYACLVPGHFDAGMIGTIVVRP